MFSSLFVETQHEGEITTRWYILCKNYMDNNQYKHLQMNELGTLDLAHTSFLLFVHELQGLRKLVNFVPILLKIMCCLVTSLLEGKTTYPYLPPQYKDHIEEFEM